MRGSIPEEFSGLKETLQKLDLKDNKFHGQIPTDLGSLTELTYLDLGAFGHTVLSSVSKTMYLGNF